MALYLGDIKIAGSNIAMVNDTTPIGTINIWSGVTPPTGWMLCDGSAISRTDYALLFGVIGTTYGSGDGSTTFNLPNLKGRAGFGFDSTQTEFDTLGETGGEKAHTLTVNELPSHTHGLSNIVKDTFDSSATTKIAGVESTFVDDDNVTDATGGGEAHNNLPPYLTINYIIKAKIVAPISAVVEDSLISESTSNALSARQGKVLNEKIVKDESHIGMLGNAIGLRGWNQLQLTNVASKTHVGITYTNNGDGSLTLNGTSTGSSSCIWTTQRIVSVANHKYLVCGCPNGGSLSTYNIILWKNDSERLATDIGQGVIYTANASGYYLDVEPIVANGVTVSNLVFKPQLFDLTALFGAGNEPTTVSDFKAMFPAEYYPYCSGSAMDLLWTNASPTSAFAAQTITLNSLPNYKWLVMLCNMSTQYSGYKNTTLIPNINSNFALQVFDGNTIEREARFVYITGNDLVFRSGYVISGASITTNDNNCIPYQIYGIK